VRCPGSEKVIQLDTKKTIQTRSVTGCSYNSIMGLMGLNRIRGLDTSAFWRYISTKLMKSHPRIVIFIY
jgi:hypothetical protein